MKLDEMMTIFFLKEISLEKLWQVCSIYNDIWYIYL